jgi:hypothetical protein
MAMIAMLTTHADFHNERSKRYKVSNFVTMAHLLQNKPIDPNHE